MDELKDELDELLLSGMMSLIKLDELKDELGKLDELKDELDKFLISMMSWVSWMS